MVTATETFSEWLAEADIADQRLNAEQRCRVRPVGSVVRHQPQVRGAAGAGEVAVVHRPGEHRRHHASNS